MDPITNETVNSHTNTGGASQTPRVECSASHDTEITANDGEITDDEVDLSLEKESQFDKINSDLGLDEVDCKPVKHQIEFNNLIFLIIIFYTFIGRVTSSKLQARSNKYNLLSISNYNYNGAFIDVFTMMILQWTYGQWTSRMPMLLLTSLDLAREMMSRTTTTPAPTKRISDLPMFFETKDLMPP